MNRPPDLDALADGYAMVPYPDDHPHFVTQRFRVHGLPPVDIMDSWDPDTGNGYLPAYGSPHPTWPWLRLVAWSLVPVRPTTWWRRLWWRVAPRRRLVEVTLRYTTGWQQ